MENEDTGRGLSGSQRVHVLGMGQSGQGCEGAHGRGWQAAGALASGRASRAGRAAADSPPRGGLPRRAGRGGGFKGQRRGSPLLIRARSCPATPPWSGHRALYC